MLKDVDLSLVISGKALRVILFSHVSLVYFVCILLLVACLLLHVKPSLWRLSVIGGKSIGHPSLKRWYTKYMEYRSKHRMLVSLLS